MAYVSPHDKKRHVELGSFIVDYNDVDVLLLENVSDIAPLYPLKPMTTLIAVCSKGRQRLTANNQHIEITEGKALICPPNIQVSEESIHQTLNVVSSALLIISCVVCCATVLTYGSMPSTSISLISSL